jgi:hypothetical protein
MSTTGAWYEAGRNASSGESRGSMVSRCGVIMRQFSTRNSFDLRALRMTFQSRKEDGAQRNSLNTTSGIAAEEGTTISSPRGHGIDLRSNAIAMTQSVEPYRTLTSAPGCCWISERLAFTSHGSQGWLHGGTWPTSCQVLWVDMATG